MRGLLDKTMSIEELIKYKENKKKKCFKKMIENTELKAEHIAWRLETFNNIKGVKPAKSFMLNSAIEIVANEGKNLDDVEYKIGVNRAIPLSKELANTYAAIEICKKLERVYSKRKKKGTAKGANQITN